MRGEGQQHQEGEADEPRQLCVCAGGRRVGGEQSGGGAGARPLRRRWRPSVTAYGGTGLQQHGGRARFEACLLGEAGSSRDGGQATGSTVRLRSSIFSKVLESRSRSCSSIQRTGVIAQLCASKSECSSLCSQKKTSAGLPGRGWRVGVRVGVGVKVRVKAVWNEGVTTLAARSELGELQSAY